ncbi:hypothetical protein TPA0906_00800 [Streptomyces olivaceus]|nr:hypothetical protein TPA0906_00800 [Streptomyces olivaceus]
MFENLRRCLASAGATFDDVVKLTYFVTDMAHMGAIRAARAAHLSDDRLPAASAVQVGALVRPEFLMETEAFAVVGPVSGARAGAGAGPRVREMALADCERVSGIRVRGRQSAYAGLVPQAVPRRDGHRRGRRAAPRDVRPRRGGRV